MTFKVAKNDPSILRNTKDDPLDVAASAQNKTSQDSTETLDEADIFHVVGDIIHVSPLSTIQLAFTHKHDS
jgi:hypothetical protein